MTPDPAALALFRERLDRLDRLYSLDAPPAAVVTERWLVTDALCKAYPAVLDDAADERAELIRRLAPRLELTWNMIRSATTPQLRAWVAEMELVPAG